MKAKILPFRILFLALVIFLFTNNPLKANMSGAIITYQCTSTPGVYQITLQVYRACNGLGICGCPLSTCNRTVQIFGLQGGNWVAFGSSTLNIVSNISGNSVIKTNPTFTDICTNCNTRTAGTVLPGIEAYVFTGTVNLNSLPSSVCMVKVGFSIDRTGNLAIPASSSVNFSYFTECTINRCVTPCNSSPIIQSEPFKIARVNTLQNYYTGAVDPDNDSISIHLATALTGINQPAVYNSGFSPTAPFFYLGYPLSTPPLALPSGIDINNENRSISFRPTSPFTSSLILEYRHWRKINNIDSFMGSARADYNIHAVNYQGNGPFIRTYNNVHSATQQQPQTHYTIVANQNWCITVAGRDVDDFDTTDVEVEYTPFRNELSITKLLSTSRHDSVRICWTPSMSRVRSQPYVIPILLKTRYNQFQTNPFPSERVFQPLFVTVNSTIPVKLTSFTGYLKNNTVRLDWQTAQEINNKGFSVQRTFTPNKAESWKNIGFISGMGNSNNIQNYSYTDVLNEDVMFEPIIYYRLMQQDFDGSVEYSNIVTVENQFENDFSIYPNPASKNVYITIPLNSQNQTSIQLFDISGKLVKNIMIEANSATKIIDMSDLPKGLYFAQLNHANILSKTIKLIIE